MKEHPVLLLVVRERGDDTALPAFLRRQGHEVVRAADAESTLKALADARPDALVAEWRAPRIDGPALAALALARDPDLCVVLLAADAPPEAVAAAIRAGVHDVLERPVHRARLMAALERGLARRRLARHAAHLQARLDERYAIEGVVARSSAMQRVVEQVRHVAATRAGVLIEGEPGSGRRTLARVIHRLGPRRSGPFVAVDCGALSAELSDGELFGVERGADPGGSRRGRVEEADGGSLLLADVDRLSLASQVRLLRLLHDGAFERVGGGGTLRADVRVLATVGADLERAVAAGRFREDLARRLTAVRIALPPLRARGEDLPALADAFVREADRALRRRVTGLSRGALERLAAQPWPGNLRELREVLGRMVAAARGRRALTLSDLPAGLRPEEPGNARLDVAVGMTMEEIERHLIRATLERTGGDKVRAAQMLGIGLRTLYRKLERYGAE